MAVLPPDPVFNLRQIEMGAVNCICFHKADRLFSGTTKGAVYLWDLQTNRSPLHFSIGSEPVTSIHHLDETLVTQQKGGIIKTWNISKCGYQLDTTIDTDHKGFCRFDCVAEQDILVTPSKDNDIIVYDINDFSIQHTLQPSSILNEKEPQPPLGQVMCLKHIRLSDQNYVLAGYESGTFLTWDLRTNTVINTAKFEECPMAFDFCAESNRGIYGNASDKLGIFGYIRNEMKLINRGDIAIKNAGINCIKIRKDQKVFCSGGWDGRVRVFSWKSLRPLTVLTDHKAAITDISYSNEKVDLWKAPIMATSGSDGQISLWNLYN